MATLKDRDKDYYSFHLLHMLKLTFNFIGYTLLMLITTIVTVFKGVTCERYSKS